MKLFLDTNVIIDHALARVTGQPLEAKLLISWAFKNNIPLYISHGSLYTFTYLLLKYGNKQIDLKSKIKMYLSFLNVINTNKEALLLALDSSFKDIEDSFQYMAAVQEKCDYLITSNIDDFKAHQNGKTLSITPYDFVTTILKKEKGLDF